MLDEGQEVLASFPPPRHAILSYCFDVIAAISNLFRSENQSDPQVLKSVGFYLHGRGVCRRGKGASARSIRVPDAVHLLVKQSYISHTGDG